MSEQRYWVIGGEFRSTQFDELLDGSARVFGPFDSQSTAERVWRDNSEQYRSSCCTRFTIVQEPQRAAAS
jgi:hypothetical protein